MQDKAKKSKGKVQEKWYWNWLSKHLYMAVAAVAIVVFALFSMLDVITRHNKELEVPSFAGLSVEDAQVLAQQNHLRLEVTDSVHIIKMTPGVVYKQNPQVGSKVKKNRRILLTINANTPKMVKMPSLVGHSLRQAQSELAAQQLRVGKLIYEGKSDGLTRAVGFFCDVDNSHDDYKFVIVGMFGSIHLANEREGVQESSGHYRQVNCMAILYFQKTFEFLFTTFACLVFLTCAILQEGTAQLCDGSRLGSHHRTKQSFEFQWMFFYTAHKYLRMIGYVL